MGAGVIWELERIREKKRLGGDGYDLSGLRQHRSSEKEPL